jgi:hypothetical protein
MLGIQADCDAWACMATLDAGFGGHACCMHLPDLVVKLGISQLAEMIWQQQWMCFRSVLAADPANLCGTRNGLSAPA